MHYVGRLDITATPTVLGEAPQEAVGDGDLHAESLVGSALWIKTCRRVRKGGLGRGQSWTVIPSWSMPQSRARGALELSHIEARSQAFLSTYQTIFGCRLPLQRICDLGPSKSFSPRASPGKWLSCEPSAVDIPGIWENRYLHPGGRIWTVPCSMHSTHRTYRKFTFFQAFE